MLQSRTFPITWSKWNLELFIKKKSTDKNALFLLKINVLLSNSSSFPLSSISLSTKIKSIQPLQGIVAKRTIRVLDFRRVPKWKPHFPPETNGIFKKPIPRLALWHEPQMHMDNTNLHKNLEYFSLLECYMSPWNSFQSQLAPCTRALYGTSILLDSLL